MCSNLKISICIASYNGAQKLPLTLQALMSDKTMIHEVIVYDDGSKDNTLEVLEEYKTLLPLKIISGNNVGRASARNMTYKNATGDIVMFIDDDIIIPDHAISVHLSFHNKQSKAILSAPSFTIENEFDFSKFKIYLEKKWNETALNDKNNKAFSAACFSIKKDHLEKLGGFMSGLNDAEDFEFGIRARKSGLQIMVDPNIWTKHNDKINCERFIIRNRQYFIANRKLKDEGILVDNQYVSSTPAFFKKCFFYFLAKPYFVKLVDTNFFIWLYEPIRYKLYDYIASAFIYYFPEKKIE